MDKRKRRPGHPKQATQSGPEFAAILPPPSTLQRYRIWDLPTRVSHWLIASLFSVLFITGHVAGAATLHLWAGYLLLVTVLFRLAWGLIGSSSALFGNMLAGPRAVTKYLRLLFSRTPTFWPGHNPVGAWSSLLLLGMLLLQCFTGLFVESWAETRGPLAERIDRGTALLFGDLHLLASWLLLALVLVHVSATVFYLLAKRENRIYGIFFDGRVRLPRDPQLRGAAPWRAWLALAVCACAVLALVRFGSIA